MTSQISKEKIDYVEKHLKNLGFKKCWLSDKSGYWFKKEFIFARLPMSISVEPENNYIALEIKVKASILKSDNRKQYETIEDYSCQVKTINMLYNRYVLAKN